MFLSCLYLPLNCIIDLEKLALLFTASFEVAVKKKIVCIYTLYRELYFCRHAVTDDGLFCVISSYKCIYCDLNVGKYEG